MDFRTVIRPLAGQKGFISHDSRVMLVGSCFSDNISECLIRELFTVCDNPFGPLYNPVSVRRSFEVLASGKRVGETDLFAHSGLFHSFLFHSRFSAPTQDGTLQLMNSRISEACNFMRRATVIFVTLGTTRIFISRKTGEVVANCHKLPGGEFMVKYLNLPETIDAVSGIVEAIRSVNESAYIVFTVSPLRYFELGAHGNQLSKSTLLLGIDELINSGRFEGLHYFPAYEVMMDDLRDYRFYAEDMKHPSRQAVEYIYQLLKDSYFDDETLATAKEASAFTRRLSHLVMSRSPEAREQEFAARRRAAGLLVRRYPKLKDACERYIDSMYDNEI